jgi:pyridoxal phosphate enzyme (YggS family)
MGIGENLIRLQRDVPSQVQIIAVSKTIPAAVIRQVYDMGQRSFGENKVKELLEKQEQLPPDVKWHLIGHLQTNKVRQIVPVVHLIHSVDSLKLLRAINDEAFKIERIIDCLLQIRIAQEESKFGLTMEEAESIFASREFASLKNVRITGLMGMATYTPDMEQVRQEFSRLFLFFQEVKRRWLPDPSFRDLSMGMSGDYKVAISCGSTMVRIGSLIFGERNYNR